MSLTKFALRDANDQPLHSIYLDVSHIRSIWAKPVGCQVRTREGYIYELMQSPDVVENAGAPTGIHLGARDTTDDTYDGEVRICPMTLISIIGHPVGSTLLWENGFSVDVMQTPDIVAGLLNPIQPSV